ncbi:MAG: G5 domain-containing protein [Anaerolineae bacterium]|nr:G5 domain-containing protein [Anaerolineae bacterium]
MIQNWKLSTLTAIALFGLILSAACAAPRLQPGQIQVSLHYDGLNQAVSVPSGSTARQAFDSIGVDVELLDRSEPPLYSVLSEGVAVQLVRVTEELQIQEEIIPFDTRTLLNESLPEGELRLVQPGQNGVQETTIRRVYENGVEISSNPVQSVTIVEPVAEIVMVGSQALFSPQPLHGRLAYISANNAWVMDRNTGTRNPIVTSGDLDGHIFSLSPDGAWLLYTRSDDDPDDEIINSLWLTRIDGEDDISIDLSTNNVIHFATWVPRSNNRISVSTVEFTTNPPGWSANNDLILMNYSENGWVGERRTIIEPNSGGLYGWWGTYFAWSPDGEQLAFARPDSVGLVDFESAGFTPLYKLIPFQTGSDWAWVPGLTWSPDQTYLYTVSHIPQEGLISPEESPIFDLTAIPLVLGAPVSMAPEVGMFAYPVPSASTLGTSGERGYRLAFLTAMSPLQSLTSGYRLIVSDRDGSNAVMVFPPDGAPGLSPQYVAWSPAPSETDAPEFIAVIYQGNLWLVNALTGQSHQLTGDGTITALDWR